MPSLPDDPLGYQVTFLMADAAQVVERKLYILGGGISVLPARPVPVALALMIRVPWDLADTRHDWRIELLDEDAMPVMARERPVLVSGEFRASRPEDLAPGIPLDIPLAINFAALPLAAGNRYVWRLSIDDDTETDWQVSFNVRGE